MALPVSAYQPSLPIFPVNQNTAPNVLIDYHQSIQSNRQYLVTRTLNEVIGRAQNNPARMFCYNMLAQNNFENEIVLDLVRFVNDYSNMLYLRRKANVIVEIIESAAQEAATFLTSLLMYRFTDLRSIVEPQIVNAAEQNLDVFQRVLNELENFYRRNTPYFQMFLGQNLQEGFQQMSSPFPNQNQGPVQVFVDPSTGYPYYQPVQAPGVSYPTQQYPNQAAYFQPRNVQQLPQGAQPFGQPGQPVHFHQRPEHTAGSQAEMFSDRFGRSGPVQEQNTVSEFFGKPEGEGAEQMQAIPITYTIKDWRATLDDPYLILSNPLKHDQFFDMLETGQVVQILQEKSSASVEELEKEQMDKAAHQRFFSKTVVNPLEQVRRDADTLFAVTENTIETAKETNNIGLISETIYHDIFMPAGLEEMVQRASYEHEKQTSLIYRMFAIVCMPVYSKADSSDIMRRLSTSLVTDGFEGFKDQFRKEFTRAYNSSTVTATDQGLSVNEIKREAHGVMKFLQHFDQYVTSVFNDFVTGTMSLKITMDSFHEDYLEFKNLIARRYPKLYLRELENFEESLRKRLIPNIDKDTVSEVKESLILEMTDGVVVTVIPKTVSLTLIDAPLSAVIDESLIADLKESPMLILKKNQPLLYKIARSIFEQSPAMLDISAPLENLMLIGNYPGIFRLYKGAIGNEAYLIGMK